jgi:peroxiredoxin
MSAAIYLAETCRLYVLIALAFAAWGKSVRLDEFRESLVDSFGVPQGMSGLAAVGIVGLEWSTAALILGRGTWERIGMLIALLLLAAFTAVILVALLGNRIIRCRCFGSSNHTISAYDVARNATFISACGFNLAASSRDAAIDPLSHVMIAGVALIAFLISVRLRDIAHLIRFRGQPPPAVTFTLPIDTPVPDFDAQRLTDGTRVSTPDLAGHSTVMVFVSAACKECHKRIPELVQMQAAMRQAGVALLIVGMDSERRIRGLLKDSPLLDHVILLSSVAHRKLNPTNSTPFYIFIDEQKRVRASNLVGDEDWQSFVEQMREVALA